MTDKVSVCHKDANVRNPTGFVIQDVKNHLMNVKIVITYLYKLIHNKINHCMPGVSA